MRIVQILYGRVNNALGGTERVYINMANEMVKRGHQVANIYFDKEPGKPLFDVDKRVYLKNCYNKKYIKCIKFLTKLRTLFVFSRDKRHKMIRQINDSVVFKRVQEFNPDVVMLYWPVPLIYTLNKWKVPTITMFHMSPIHFETDECVRNISDGLADCDCIQVLMPEYKAQLYEWVKNKNIVHIPNIVPQYDVQSDYSKKNIIFVGRMDEQKRPWLIPQAFALIKDKYPDWKVEMWGETHIKEHITQQVTSFIEENNMQNNVLLCGTTLDIPCKLQQSSIVLMPSAHEGFPLATTEAMSMGLPAVVCNDCPSHNTLIRHNENGLLCSPTPEDIAAKLDILMSDYELRKKLGNRAKEDMKSYRPDIIYDQWEKLMKEIVAKSNKLSSIR